MASSWLFRPLPLRERVGRVVAPVSSTLRTRRLVVPSPPHPNPLPRGEREPEVPSAKGVIANSTVLGLGVKQVLISDVPFFLPRGVLSAIPIVLRALTLLERKSPTLHTRPSVGYVKSALIIAAMHCNHALPAPIFLGSGCRAAA